jgi:hypothetical protein
MAEGRRLQRIGRTARDPVKLRPAIVLLMSAQGQSVPDIANLLGVRVITLGVGGTSSNTPSGV